MFRYLSSWLSWVSISNMAASTSSAARVGATGEIWGHWPGARGVELDTGGGIALAVEVGRILVAVLEGGIVEG